MGEQSTIIAKTDGTTLYSHTKSVINLSSALIRNISSDERYIRVCCTAAALHDIGKCATPFQTMVKKSKDNNSDIDENTEIRHNVLSWAFASRYLNKNTETDWILNAILFHHTVPPTAKSLSDIDILENNSSDISTMSEFYRMICNEYESLSNLCPSDNKSNPTAIASLNIFQRGADEMEGIFTLIRSILVCADRTVSSGKYDNNRIELNDTEYIASILDNMQKISSLDSFDLESSLSANYDAERLSSQKSMIIDAIDNQYKLQCKNSIVIPASAGYGKTLMGVINIILRKRKTVWCVPTREIAASTYYSICSEIKKMNCPLSVCLYYGNEIQGKTADKKDISEFDIVVSVIDSMLSRFYHNNTAHQLYSLLASDAIFDEYHNVVTKNALFAAACHLWKTRMFLTKAYSLFLSATPLDFYNADLKSKRYIHEYKPTVYRGDIHISFFYTNDDSILDSVQDTSFVLTNTVAQAQKVYSRLKALGKNVLLVHANYTKERREELRKILFDNFGKGKINSSLIVVSTGGFIGTGLDVSAKCIYDFTLAPSDTLQRVCGRASRFAEYDSVIYYLCDFANDEFSNSNKVFIQNVYDKDIRRKFISMMMGKTGTVFTKTELYDIVTEFNKDNEQAIHTFHLKMLKESKDSLNSIELRSVSKSKKNGTTFASKNTTLRGDGNEIFVAVQYKDSFETFSVDINSVRNKECNQDNTDSRKKRLEFYKKNCNFSKSWKYKYGIKDSNTCNFDTCIKLAYYSDTPLPLFSATYDDEYGLMWHK